jgi:hypothetical protein
MLKTTHASAARLDRFANCGSGCTVQWSNTEQRCRLSANYCHDRLCVPCGIARGARISSGLKKACQSRTVRFVTLTLKRNFLPLADQITRLYRCFSTLRRRGFWLGHVKGGAAVLEVKWKPEHNAWHPHLHLLVETDWLPQKDLSENWYAVTGDSYIVDVGAIDNERTVGYVCKYVAKPVESSVYESPAALAEFAGAIKGRRLCLTFGSWRGLDLDGTNSDPGDWATIGTLARLLADARAGDGFAQAMISHLRERAPIPEERPPPSAPTSPQTH